MDHGLGLKVPEYLDISSDNLPENWRKFKASWTNFYIGRELKAKPKDVQKAIFLNIIGPDAEDVINSLDLSDEDSETVAKLIEALDGYVKPKTNIVFSRYLFLTRSQEDGEDFETFLLALKKLAENCEFGQLKTSLIRDRIIIGIVNQHLRERLLGEENDYNKVVKLCRAVEKGKQRATEISNDSVKTSTTEVNWINTQDNRQQPSTSKQWRKPGSNQPDLSSSNFQPATVIKTINDCRNCGYNHPVRQCPAFGQKCSKCNVFNHFPNKCKNGGKNANNSDNKFKSNRKSFTKNTDSVSFNLQNFNSAGASSSDPNVDLNADAYFQIDEVLFSNPGDSNVEVNNSNQSEPTHREIHTLNKNKPRRRWYEKVQINDFIVNVKLDSGSDVNLIPMHIFNRIRRTTDRLIPDETPCFGYGGSPIVNLGEVLLTCKLLKNNKCYNLPFTISQTGEAPLFSLDTCVELGLIYRNKIDSVSQSSKEQIVSHYEETFRGVGEFPDRTNLKVKTGSVPQGQPLRRFPISLMDKLRRKLNELVMFDIISPDTQEVEWFSNLVIIEKPDKSMRMCLDPKYLNKSLQREHFHIPTLEEIKPKLLNKKFFSVLDVKDGFWHCKLTPEASNLCGFHTPFGSFKFLRLPFGVNNSPEIFQRLLTKYFGDISNVIIYFDDILICAETEAEHDKALREVLNRAFKLNIKFNINKFQYKQPTVRYMGHIISADGISPNEEYLKAIFDLQNPKNRKELQSILGTVNYIREYIPNLADLIHPLRSLLKKNTKFVWTVNHTECLNKIKKAVASVADLSNFDPNKKIVIQCDASQFGLGAVLLQDNRPIAFASRCLTDAESRYAQIEKEMLSIVFACKRFHQLIYGFKVNVENDHKPLESIFLKPISQVMSNRLQRLLLKLIQYDLEVKYLPGPQMYVADMLSRNFSKEIYPEDEVQLTDVVHSVEVKFQISDQRLSELQKETSSDPVLKLVKQMYVDGWTKCKHKSVEPYFKLRNNISMNDDVIYFNNRIVVPTSMQEYFLKLLHSDAHLGQNKTIARAKQVCFWPTYLTDIEKCVKSCVTCSKFQPKKVKEPLIPHDIPELPFFKVGADICESQAKFYLVLSDYYSKWLEVKKIPSKTSKSVIAAFKEMFRTHGIPNTVIADNQPFGSVECKNFAKTYNFNIINSSPNYPQSNGLAENAVKRAKTLLKKAVDSKTDFELAILEYNNAPIIELGVSPAQLLMSRSLRTKIPTIDQNLIPNVVNVQDKRKLYSQKVKVNYDRSAKKHPEFKKDESVLLRNKDNRWYPAQIVEKIPNVPRSYQVENHDGKILRRNSQFIRKNFCKPVPSSASLLFYSDSEGESDSESSPDLTEQPNVANMSSSEPSSNNDDNDITIISADSGEPFCGFSESSEPDFRRFITESSELFFTPNGEESTSVADEKVVQNINTKSSTTDERKKTLRGAGRGVPKKLHPEFVKK